MRDRRPVKSGRKETRVNGSEIDDLNEPSRRRLGRTSSYDRTVLSPDTSGVYTKIKTTNKREKHKPNKTLLVHNIIITGNLFLQRFFGHVGHDDCVGLVVDWFSVASR